MKFFVYAKRGGNPPRPLAGPFDTAHQARAFREPARHVASARHYLSSSDVVYTGPASRDVEGRVGIVNQWIGLPTALPAGALA